MSERSQDSEGLLSPVLSHWRLAKVAEYIRPKDRVLDCGCGSGRLRRFLPPACSYVGIDVKATAVSSGASGDAAFLRADVTLATDLRRLQPLGPFHVIVMAALLEHLGRPAAVLRALTVHLEEAGYFIVTTPSPRIRFIHELGGRLGLFSRHGAQEHKALLTDRDIHRIAEQAGLCVLEFSTFQAGLNQIALLGRQAGD
jgi:2-polyprenyl-3-methyl-5-hydroxy-6-metoxy-1,4-benzoquinol methylase